MDDFDVEAMLEAPYNKNKSADEDDDGEKDDHYMNGINEKRSRKHRDRSDYKRRSKDDEDDYIDRKVERKREDYDSSPSRNRSSKTYKRSSVDRKNRSRSRSGSHENKHEYMKISRERERKAKSRERGRSREKERAHTRDIDRYRRDPEERKKSREPHRSSRDQERRRSRSRDSRRRSRERRPRSGSRDIRPSRPRRSGSREKRRSPSRGERRLSPIKERNVRSRSDKRSCTKERDVRRRTNSPRPFRRGRTPLNGLGDRSPLAELSPEERDARTVFCMQLSQRVRARDLEEFFSSVGKVRDVRLITCNKTKRFKGIAYIEFQDPESVALALGLSGQRLLGVPISVQHTQAEKNRIANAPTFAPKKHTGPMRLFVGSLHFNISEDMLRGIFEPFGKIDNIQLVMDSDTGRSKGYGFITYHNADDAKKALEQLNGFELAGRPMKVGNVTERLDMNTDSLDTEEMDRRGIDLGATGRLQLMFKLAEGAGLAVPQAAANALLATAPQPAPAAHLQTNTPPIATQCFMLSNMFDPRTETNPAWDVEIRDDVIEECSKHGGVLHIHVDKTSLTGNVYVKCPSIATAVLAVNALHGRWFAGRVIAAAYVPLLNYHSLFPDAITAVNLLSTTRKLGDD